MEYVSKSMFYFLCSEIASDPELSDRLSAVSGLEGGQGGTFQLSDFTYSSDDLRNVIFRHLTETNITGITVSDCNPCTQL